MAFRMFTDSGRAFACLSASVIVLALALVLALWPASVVVTHTTWPYELWAFALAVGGLVLAVLAAVFHAHDSAPRVVPAPGETVPGPRQPPVH